MRRNQVRMSPEGVDLFSENSKVGGFTRALVKLFGQNVDLGPSDVGRIHSGDWRMNPAVSTIPSTIVSPQVTWMPALPEVSLLLVMLWSITEALDKMEDGEEGSGSRPRMKRERRFQILDFNQMLPEA